MVEMEQIISVDAPEATGRYELLAELMTGPLGALWAARTLSGSERGRLVTIRRVSTLAAAPALVDRLIGNASAALDVRHSGVVATLDLLPELEAVSIVSEYVEGETLASLLATAIATHGPLPAPVAVRVCLDVLTALSAAKQQWRPNGSTFPSGGLLPHSVLVAAFGEAMVCDLGVARAALELPSLSGSHAALRYRAPEQTPEGPDDERADVYAVGAMLWEMLANQQLPQLPPALDRLERSGPPVATALVRLVERALAPDANARIATFADMIAELYEPSIDVAAPEQVLLTLERLARPALEARRARFRAPLPSERPERSAPSNRPTLAPQLPVVGGARSERPAQASSPGFSEHERPTFSEHARLARLETSHAGSAPPPGRELARVELNGSLAVAPITTVELAADAEPIARRSTAGLRPWLALFALVVVALVVVFVLSRGEERSPVAASPQRSNAPTSAASAPVAEPSAEEQLRTQEGAPPATQAEIVPAVQPSARAPQPPLPAREREEPGAKTRAPGKAPTKRESAFRPHGP
jgi:serine/threonine-protein kinase